MSTDVSARPILNFPCKPRVTYFASVGVAATISFCILPIFWSPDLEPEMAQISR